MSEPVPAKQDRCINCGQALHGDFCAACGQSNRRPRLDIREIVSTALDHLVELDLPVVRTFVGLSLRPGRLCRAYVEGRRKPYTNPIKYSFLTLTLLVLVFGVFDISPSEGVLTMFGFERPEPARAVGPAAVPATDPDRAPTTTERIDEAIGSSRDYSRMVELSLAYLSFPAIPIAALALMLLFRRSGYRFAEHYVFAMYAFGQTFLISSVFSLIGSTTHPALFVVDIGVNLAYLSWAACGFYGQGPVRATLKMLAAQLVLNIATSIFGALLITGVITYRITMVFMTPA